ncbi:hypothetical protein STIAU_2640 [Stigmatella aurantiaca DW4/3-1]|uniref:Uncharacterized protein n=1 Tax=Stigmatella aurantiaca (strain DW4/3-1) TaxID=378806 RepID=Q094G2_STIAD|nr:hypothetical protein STIAU_2640 [Stigmatella aurantiaca DW4/3-1]
MSPEGSTASAAAGLATSMFRDTSSQLKDALSTEILSTVARMARIAPRLPARRGQLRQDDRTGA